MEKFKIIVAGIGELFNFQVVNNVTDIRTDRNQTKTNQNLQDKLSILINKPKITILIAKLHIIKHYIFQEHPYFF